jgi:hypothetical protein
MKICEAFRKAWEKDITDRAIRQDIDFQVKWGLEHGTWQEKDLEKKIFEYWVTEWHAFLSRKEVTDYGITTEMIDQAKEAGYLYEWERFNTATRYRGAPSYGLQLKPKGRMALYKAFKTWEYTKQA